MYRGSRDAPAPHRPSDARLEATFHPTPRAQQRRCRRPPLQALLLWRREPSAMLSPGRGALRRPRWHPVAPSRMARSDSLGTPATRHPPWRARRATPRGFAQSPLANARRARESASDVRTLASDENLSNFFSQLLPRRALQVSIDKERATPPPPPQKKTYHRYTGGSGPGERLASAL